MWSRSRIDKLLHFITASIILALEEGCYDLKFLESDNRTTLILSNTRELNRDPFTK